MFSGIKGHHVLIAVVAAVIVYVIVRKMNP